MKAGDLQYLPGVNEIRNNKTDSITRPTTQAPPGVSTAFVI